MVAFGSFQKRLALAAAVTFGALLFTGCAAQGDGVAANPPTTSADAAPNASAPPPAASPTPTASLTPPSAPVNLDDPASWVIDFTSVGPLTIGGEISAVPQSMTAFTSAVYEGCPSVTSYDKVGFPTVVVPDRLGDGIIEQIVLQSGLSAAEVSSNSPRTSSGIGIGSTLDELTVAYPTITFIEDHSTPHYAVSDDNGNWINFSIYENLVNNIVVRASSVVSTEYCG